MLGLNSELSVLALDNSELKRICCLPCTIIYLHIILFVLLLVSNLSTYMYRVLVSNPHCVHSITCMVNMLSNMFYQHLFLIYSYLSSHFTIDVKIIYFHRNSSKLLLWGYFYFCVHGWPMNRQLYKCYS